MCLCFGCHRDAVLLAEAIAAVFAFVKFAMMAPAERSAPTIVALERHPAVLRVSWIDDPAPDVTRRTPAFPLELRADDAAALVNQPLPVNGSITGLWPAGLLFERGSPGWTRPDERRSP